MERYFDAFLYLASWGTRRLMIRLPRGLLELGLAERYCTGDAASARAAAGHVIEQAQVTCCQLGTHEGDRGQPPLTST